MKYSDTRSDFVRKKIKETVFDKRDYIDDLLFLEKSITVGISGWAGNMKLSGLKKQYSEEYAAIYQELDLDGWKEFLETENQRKLEAKVRRAEEKKRERKRLEQIKQEWLDAGGRE